MGTRAYRAAFFALVLWFLPAAALATDIPLDPGAGGMSITASSLQPGDLIFSTTPDLVSTVIRSLTNGPVSHVKIFRGMVGGVPWVIEVCCGQGVVQRDLDTSTADDSLDVAFRYPGITKAQGQQVVDFAMNHQGGGFDYFGAATMVLFNFLGDPGYTEDFDGSGQHRFFCSQLVIAAYNNAGASLVSNAPAFSPAQLAQLSWVNGLVYVGHLKYVPRNTSMNVRARESRQSS